MITRIAITLVLCYISDRGMDTQNPSEVDTNVLISCGGHITGGSRPFWIIKEALYGLLQVPREYRVSLTQQELVIPALRRDMNGSTPFELPNGMVCSILINYIHYTYAQVHLI